MAQWLGVETNQGLIDETMKLSTNPTQGEWTIKVLHHNRDFSQKFTVGEYGELLTVGLTDLPKSS